jgi:hypothetical protein
MRARDMNVRAVRLASCQRDGRIRRGKKVGAVKRTRSKFRCVSREASCPGWPDQRLVGARVLPASSGT